MITDKKVSKKTQGNSADAVLRPESPTFHISGAARGLRQCIRIDVPSEDPGFTLTGIRQAALRLASALRSSSLLAGGLKLAVNLIHGEEAFISAAFVPVADDTSIISAAENLLSRMLRAYPETQEASSLYIQALHCRDGYPDADALMISRQEIQLMRNADRMREKFGPQILQPASALMPPRPVQGEEIIMEVVRKPVFDFMQGLERRRKGN
ncbi:MAG: hypothetical protein V4543_08830 [Bacteroidota bacterium]